MTRAWGMALLVAAGLSGPVVAQDAPGGQSPEIAAQLRAIGPVVAVPLVDKIYAPILARQPKDGVTVTSDVAYGSDERQKVDVYAPSARPAAPMPIAVFFHGGGFVRGARTDRANIGYFLARNGVVAILAGYRLAPQNPWPAGPQDVASTIAWARQHAGEYGGDPARIVLMGESAGAGHAAAAALMHAGSVGDLKIAGLVLLSGIYDADMETRAKAQFGLPTPDPRNDAYYGTDPAAMAAKSVALHVVAPLPQTLLAYADLDPPQMQMQAGELFGVLCRIGPCPSLMLMRDHDHGSSGASFNTPDTSVSGPVLDFIRKSTPVP